MPFGAAVLLVVVAQISALVGIGDWVPFAAPGLWTDSPTVALADNAQIGVASAVAIAVIAGALTAYAWRRRQA